MARGRARVATLAVALATAAASTALGDVGRTAAARGDADRGGAAAAARTVDVVFVLDNSGSMRRNDPARATPRIVATFAAGMPPDGRLGVVLFDETARVAEPLTSAVGPEARGHWLEAMRVLDYRGQRSNSPAGIERALYLLRHEGRAGAGQAIVFVTDGLVDTGDPARDVEKTRWLKDELAVEARRAGVRVYGIAFTEAADVELIQALALATGGDYWRVAHADEIATVLARVAVRLGEAPRAVAEAPPPGSGPAAGVAPVAAAPADRTRGVVLLSLGLALGALVVAYPLIERRRRRPRIRPSAFADPVAVAHDVPPLPVLPRGGRPPVVQLVDVSDAMGRDHAVLLLDRPSTRIGRDPECEVPIPSDTVSSFHATIDYRDGYYWIEDHRSTNGTFLNGQRLAAGRAVQLKSGDHIDVAEHPLRFLVPDHEPRGRTAALAGTAWRGAEAGGAPTDAHDTDGAGGAGDADGASGVGEAGFGGGAAAGPDAAAVGRLVAAFDHCLGAHLAKIEALGERHRRFVERAFPLEVRAQLARRAQALIERCRADGQGDRTDWSRGDVHYTLCAVPEAMDGARSWYTARHGGYAKFLVGLLDARAGAGTPCDAVCVVTFGIAATPWLSITVMPARDDAEAIEVMSYEFLSEDERRKALALDLVDVADGPSPRP